MLAKVIKHEYRATRFVIGLSAGIAFLPGLVLFAFTFLPVGNWVFAMAATISALTCAGASGFIFIYLLFRYYQTMHGQGAYQTFTTPVAPRIIYWGKIVYWTVVELLFTLFFMTLLLIYLFRGSFIWKFTMTEAVSAIMDQQVDSISPTLIIMGIASIVLYTLSSVLTWSFLVTAGNSWKFRNAGPLGGCIIVAIIYGVLSSLISLPFQFISGTIMFNVDADSNSFGLTLSSAAPIFSGDSPAIVGIGTIVISTVITVAIYLITDFLLSKRLQLR